LTIQICFPLRIRVVNALDELEMVER
jgi:hypothetical protein